MTIPQDRHVLGEELVDTDIVEARSKANVLPPAQHQKDVTWLTWLSMRPMRIFWIIVLGVLVLAAGRVLGITDVEVLIDSLQFAVFACATNLVIGYGGLVSFGQAVFYGIGAYTIGLTWLHLRLDFWIAFAAAPIVAGVAAVLIGIIVLRTRGLYFALLTLAFAQLFYTISLSQTSFTKGSTGIFGSLVPVELTNPRNAFYFVFGISLIALFVMWLITRSPFGLTLKSIRENRSRAEAIGINVFRHQLITFMISGFFCGLAGGLFVVYDNAAYPRLLDWITSGYPVFMVVIGGMTLFLGPALGALVYTVAYTEISQRTQQWELIFGIVLVLVALFAPEGLAGLAVGKRKSLVSGRQIWSSAKKWCHTLRRGMI
jgi:branched-chain amino acid transport system permease protein